MNVPSTHIDHAYYNNNIIDDNNNNNIIIIIAAYFNRIIKFNIQTIFIVDLARSQPADGH